MQHVISWLTWMLDTHHGVLSMIHCTSATVQACTCICKHQWIEGLWWFLSFYFWMLGGENSIWSQFSIDTWSRWTPRGRYISSPWGNSVLVRKLAIKQRERTKTMATVSFAKNLNKELTCAICLELFKTPKMLPCLHTFCKSCLEGVADKSAGKQERELNHR